MSHRTREPPAWDTARRRRRVQRRRCPWAERNALQRLYHDAEWGVPVHDDRTLFEFLVLEGAQAGLSWDTILKKRSHYREAFDGFDPPVVARYDRRKITALLGDPGLVRNRLKIAAAVQNARAFVDIQREFGSFDRYIWRFVSGNPKVNAWRRLNQVPAQTVESNAASGDLRRRGFRFVGPTICYAYMQAVGMVNDHLVGCFRYRELRALRRRSGSRAPGRAAKVRAGSRRCVVKASPRRERGIHG